MELNKDKEITFGKTLFFQVTEQPKPPQTSKPGRYCFRGKFYTKVLPLNSKKKQECAKSDLAKSQRTSRQTPKFRIKSSDSSDYNQSMAERYEYEMKINKLVLLPNLHRRIKSQYDPNSVQKNNNIKFKLSSFETSETQNTFEKEPRQNKKLINFKQGNITFDEKAKDLDLSNNQQSLDTSFNTFSEIKSKSNRYSNQTFQDNIQRKQQELISAKTLSEEQRSYLLDLKRQYQHLKFQLNDEKIQSDFETEQEKSQGQG